MEEDSPSRTETPAFEFDTTALPSHQRFEGWRDCIEAAFNLQPVGHKDDFQATIKGWLFGENVITQSKTAPLHWQRDLQLAARSGVDGYLVQLYEDGGYSGVTGRRELTVRPGDVVVHDMTGTSRTTTGTSHVISLLIPRHMLDNQLGREADLNGLVLSRDTPLGAFAASSIRGLAKTIPLLSSTEADFIATGAAGLIASLLNAQAGEMDAVRSAMLTSLTERALDYIRANLAGDLSVATLCAALHVSRSHLHRAFADVGGVANAVRRLRLTTAWTELRNPSNRRLSISMIAYRCGFSNDAHFSTQFKDAFGLRPSEARHVTRHSDDDPRHILTRWISPWMGTGVKK